MCGQCCLRLTDTVTLAVHFTTFRVNGNELTLSNLGSNEKREQTNHVQVTYLFYVVDYLCGTSLKPRLLGTEPLDYQIRVYTGCYSQLLVIGG